MAEFALAPYFHPTTIIFLDDNESFLQSLDLELPGHWACRTFTDPVVALEFFRQPVPLPPLMDRAFSLYRASPDQAIIHLDLGMIEQEINHVQRFQHNSVLVVDYSMPTIDGLQFCEALDDPFIRIAMLTGVADEKLAVEAFNAGLIHRFIPKQAADPVEAVRKFVTELLHEYFNQYSSRLKSTLAINPPEFLTDPAVARFVESLMEENGLVEYYLVDEPTGLLMLKANGEIWRLAVLNAKEMRAQAEQAADFHAPRPVLQAMQSGQSIAFLSGLSPADYFGDEEFPWAEHVQPAAPLQATKNDWTVAIWKGAPGDIDFDPATASYDAYLRTL